MHRRPLVITTAAIALAILSFAAANLVAPYPSRDDQPSAGSQSITKERKYLACIEQLPVDIKLGQKLVLAGYRDSLASLRGVFNDYSIGGVIVMDAIDSSQIATFVDAQTIAPIVAVDQEGGTVQRYKAAASLPAASNIAKLSTNQAYQRYLKSDRYLASQGINVNFAPVVDVKYPDSNPLPSRMYSQDPSVVTSYARQAIRAAQQAGIRPVIKHFPGLGSVKTNTDYGSATTQSYHQLKSKDLLPYRALLNLAPDVMVSNAIVPGLSQGKPASLSANAIATLRQDYGYQNAVVYTDSLTAEAITSSLAAASLQAWQADADIALIVQAQKSPTSLAKMINRIISTSRQAIADDRLAQSQIDQSVNRVLRSKNINPCDIKTSADSP